jgi:undecaprenyl-diphosphatase
MVSWLLQSDEALCLALNGCNAPWADKVMWVVSSKWLWIPLYGWLVWLLVQMFGRQVWRTLLLALLLVVITDQGAGLMKNTVKRPRPSHDAVLGDQVHVVKGYRGGPYGFFSSHAANTFGVALFAGLLLRRRHKLLLPALLVWASLVAYSRVYLGVHYPGDILAGALWGAACGAALFALHQRWLPRETRFRLHR